MKTSMNPVARRCAPSGSADRRECPHGPGRSSARIGPAGPSPRSRPRPQPSLLGGRLRVKASVAWEMAILIADDQIADYRLFRLDGGSGDRGDFGSDLVDEATCVGAELGLDHDRGDDHPTASGTVTVNIAAGCGSTLRDSPGQGRIRPHRELQLHLRACTRAKAAGTQAELIEFPGGRRCFAVQPPLSAMRPSISCPCPGEPTSAIPPRGRGSYSPSGPKERGHS